MTISSGVITLFAGIAKRKESTKKDIRYDRKNLRAPILTLPSKVSKPFLNLLGLFAKASGIWGKLG